MYLHSAAAYADQIVDTLDLASQEVLRQTKFNELSRLHPSWGRAIRNEFGLWDANHPLTQHWHNFPDERVMRNDLDYSPDHPDQVSMNIMQAVWKKVNA